MANEKKALKAIERVQRPLNNVANELPEISLANIGNSLKLIEEVYHHDILCKLDFSEKARYGLLSLIQSTGAAVEYEYQRSLSHWAELDEEGKQK